MYYEDWLTRQINMAVRAIARFVFNKDTIEYVIKDEARMTQSDMLHNQLLDLLDAQQINEAENLLFESISPERYDDLFVALDFYARVNELDNTALEVCDFSREEIENGLAEIKELFGVDI